MQKRLSAAGGVDVGTGKREHRRQPPASSSSAVLGWTAAALLVGALTFTACTRSIASQPEAALTVVDAAPTPQGSEVAEGPNEKIHFCVSPGGSSKMPLVSIVAVAIEEWTQQSGLVIPVELAGECTAAPEDHGDGLSVIGWGSLPGAVVGQTFTKQIDGDLSESDITLDSDDISEEACAVAVAMHELGHSFGLPHSSLAASIMFPVTTCSQAPSLSEEDITRLREILS